MSDELLQLGLDTEDIRRELDSLSKRFESSMARNAKATEKVGGGIKRIGAALKGGLAAAGIALTVQGFKKMAMLAVNVGKNLEAAKNRFAAGSKRLKDATGGGATNEGASLVAAAQLEDFISRMKIGAGDLLFSFANGTKKMAAGVAGAAGSLAETAGKIGNAALQMMTGVKGEIAGMRPPAWLKQWWKEAKGGAEVIKDAVMDTGAGRAVSKEAEKAAAAAKTAAAAEAQKQAEEKRRGDELARKKSAVLQIEKRIAEAEKRGVVTNQDKSDLLTYQLDLARAKRAVAYDELEADRAAQNAADAELGKASEAIEMHKNALAKEAKAAHEKAAAATLEQKGLQHIAELTEKIAGFDNQIADARRAGNTDLEKSLTTMKNLTKVQALARLHEVTPAQKRAERNRVRKEKSAARKQQARFDAANREQGLDPDGNPIKRIDFKEALARKKPAVPTDPIGGVMGKLGDVAAKRDLGRRGAEAKAFRDSLSTSEKYLEQIKNNTAKIRQNAP